MLILADEEIPGVEHYFGSYGELIFKTGRTLTHEDVCDADILLVRSVTEINKVLLQNTNVKFVGSVVSGTDHLNIDWLEQAGIRWSAALGCNAVAVAEYVVTVIAALQKKGLLLNKKSRAGVIGVGKVGSRVVEKLKIVGFDVVQCDPLRAQKEKEFISVPIEELTDLDIVLLHTPLTTDGPYPTYHLVEKNFLQKQKKGCVLLSAGRGSVIHFPDLLHYGQHLIWCLDVWENEPMINLDVLSNAMIASPHIAGHSVQSKYRGIQMVYEAAVQQGIIFDKKIPPISFPRAELSFPNEKMDWREVVLQVFDPLEITLFMQEAFRKEGPAVFDLLRKRFKRGDEFGFISGRGGVLGADDLALLKQLGFS